MQLIPNWTVIISIVDFYQFIIPCDQRTLVIIMLIRINDMTWKRLL